MQYKTLGNTGLLVSHICLGTMTFAGDDPTALSENGAIWKAIAASEPGRRKSRATSPTLSIRSATRSLSTRRGVISATLAVTTFT